MKDYEQLYYDEVYKNKKLENRVKDLEEENKELTNLANNKQWISPCYVAHNYIPKSKIRECMYKTNKKVDELFNTTYLPLNKRILNDNWEKYSPILKAREIAIETLKNLQELLEDK